MIASSAALSILVTKSLARLEVTSSGLPSSAARLMIDPARRAARTAMFRIGCISPSVQYDFTDHAAAFDARMRFAQVRCVDRPERGAQRRAHFAGVHPVGDAREQPVLLDHVGRLEGRASEHRL